VYPDFFGVQYNYFGRAATAKTLRATASVAAALSMRSVSTTLREFIKSMLKSACGSPYTMS
jgi:hypothetical protein